MIRKHEPNFERFLDVLWRRARPDGIPPYEHVATNGFMSRRLGFDLGKLERGTTERWQAYIDFWMSLGFDCVPMEISLSLPLADSQRGKTSHGSEANAVIANMQDFEAYPWPDESNPLDFSHFETAGRLLPPGVKIVGGVCMGPYEWVSQMMGVIGLSYALVDDYPLVELMFEKIGRLIHSADRQIASMEWVGALRQGDDLGFRTSTFLSPELLRKLVFPTYAKMVQEAHKNGKPFILHSCGNLQEVYPDLIECGIDAKHSFEDTILPVGEFKKMYGDRITPLGGLDVDMICRSDEQTLRAYTRRMVEECFYDGFWSIGTGNSLTDYMPVENYLIMRDEAEKVTS